MLVERFIKYEIRKVIHSVLKPQLKIRFHFATNLIGGYWGLSSTTVARCFR